MTLKTYIWGMRIITLLTLGALGAIIFYVDPQASAPLGIILFYAIFFFALTSFFNLILLFARRKIFGNEMAAANVGLSFRQAVLLALIFSGLLILQNYGMLIWWSALLVVAGIFLIELYFLSRS